MTEQLNKLGRPQCEGRRVNGTRCPEPKEGIRGGGLHRWCIYCGKLVRGETTPETPGYNPRKGRPADFGWNYKTDKWRV